MRLEWCAELIEVHIYNICSGKAWKPTLCMLNLCMHVQISVYMCVSSTSYWYGTCLLNFLLVSNISYNDIIEFTRVNKRHLVIILQSITSNIFWHSIQIKTIIWYLLSLKNGSLRLLPIRMQSYADILAQTG